MNFDEFMKDKCGGGIKENIMCMKVWEKLLEKNWSCKLCLMCQKREKNVEKRHMKKNLKERKMKRKKNTKQRMCMMWKKNRSIGENEGKMGQKDDICPYFFNMLF